MRIQTFLLVCVLCSFLVLPQAAYSGHSLDYSLNEGRMTPDTNFERAEETGPGLIISGRIAVLEDADPWGYNAVEDILNANWALAVDVIPSASFGTVDLSGYQKVIISSAQSVPFYDALVGNHTWLESYVMKGGVLEYNTARAFGYGNFTLPFGFGFILNDTDDVEVAEPTHPILNYPSTINAVDLDGWNSAAHGYFNNTNDATIILTDGNGEPVLFEQRFGLGFIVATSQPVEWAYGFVGYTDFCENLVLYVPTSYSPPDGIVTGPIAVIQDHTAWDWLSANATQEILVKYGIEYDIINSSAIGSVDLSGYQKVIISADQDPPLLSELEANRTWLESYVMAGGVLEVHAATQGSDWTLPSSIDYEYAPSDSIVAADPFHYVFYNPYFVPEAGFSGWYSSTHGYFTNTSGSSIILTNGAEPVLLEKAYGDGFIIATGQTLEYAWHMNLSYFLENLILYMPSMESPAMGPRPSDRTIEFGTTGQTLMWGPTDPRLVAFNLTRNGALIQDDNWTGQDITVSLNGLGVGTYTFLCTMWDESDRTVQDTVLVTVQDTTDPTFDEAAIDQSITHGSNFTYNLNASDLSGIDHWWISDAGNFSISGTGVITNAVPLEAGVYEIEVRAYDPYDNYGSETFTLTVVSVGLPVETLIIIAAAVLGLVLILVLVLKRRPGGAD
jgi:hypothetical protein